MNTCYNLIINLRNKNIISTQIISECTVKKPIIIILRLNINVFHLLARINNINYIIDGDTCFSNVSSQDDLKLNKYIQHVIVSQNEKP